MYEELIRRLREEPLDSNKAALPIMDLCIDAATAIENLSHRLDMAQGERDAVTRHMIELEQDVCRLKSRLAAYEDSGLEPEEIKVHEAAKYNAGYYHGDEDRCRWIEKELGSIDHLRDLLQAEQDGRLVELPFVAMVEQSLQDGKMKPMADQKHNGRYAVVYVDHNKWKSPLIDICGKPYNREEAENRMAVLALKGGEG